MKILVSAFIGENNASCKILNKITYKCDKIYFQNDKGRSKQQFYTALEGEQYDYIIMLGQKPVIKNKISIETTARDQSEFIRTDFNYTNAIDFFGDNGYVAYLSNNAGTSYCNHIYYICLKYIVNIQHTKAVFMHVPYIKNINNITLLTTVFDGYLRNLSSLDIG